jgi:hypothetical protein
MISVNLENVDDGISVQFSGSDGLEQLLLWVNNKNEVTLNRSFCEPVAVSVSISADVRGKVVSFVNALAGSIQDGFYSSRIPAELFYSTSKALKRPKLSSPVENFALISEQRIFKQFCLQELAFEYYDNLGMNRSHVCKVFSYESMQSGKRFFLVADIISFAKEYYKIKALSRHAYEIIREGFPCRAYLDLEFHIPSNSSISNGDSLTSKLINILRWKILELYDAPVADSDIFLLDSTTADKYSVHLTFHIREYYSQRPSQCRELLFENNIEVGKLLKAVAMDMTSSCGNLGDTEHAEIVDVFGEARHIYPGFEEFWVRKKDGKRTFFADLGVYTKNRAFRILGSCKFGKTAGLKVARPDRFGFSGSSNSEKLMDSRTLYQDLWLQRLPAYFVLPCNVFSSDSAGGSTLNHDLYELLPAVVDRDHDSWDFASCGRRHRAPALQTGLRKTKPLTAEVVARSMHKGEVSWFPSLDEYLTNVAASIGQVRGLLSSWELSVSSHRDFPRLKLRYQVQQNRWCGNINRPHKSNGIYLDVELMSGEWTQSCFDVDCKGYKSPPIPIPAEVLPSTEDLHAIIQKHRTSIAGTSFQHIPS